MNQLILSKNRHYKIRRKRERSKEQHTLQKLVW